MNKKKLHSHFKYASSIAFCVKQSCSLQVHYLLGVGHTYIYQQETLLNWVHFGLWSLYRKEKLMESNYLGEMHVGAVASNKLEAFWRVVGGKQSIIKVEMKGIHQPLLSQVAKNLLVGT